MSIRSLSITLVACVALAAFFVAAEPASQPATAPKTETKDNGLKIAYITAGTGAKDGDSVSILYTGKLQNGTEFDSSAKHGNEPIEFVVGKGMVIKGWDQGVQGMQLGEKRTLTIPPALAYGEAGAGGVIPPNATLTFDIEIVGMRRVSAPAQPAQ